MFLIATTKKFLNASLFLVFLICGQLTYCALAVFEICDRRHDQVLAFRKCARENTQQEFGHVSAACKSCLDNSSNKAMALLCKAVCTKNKNNRLFLSSLKQEIEDQLKNNKDQDGDYSFLETLRDEINQYLLKVNKEL